MGVCEWASSFYPVGFNTIQQPRLLAMLSKLSVEKWFVLQDDTFFNGSKLVSLQLIN